MLHIHTGFKGMATLEIIYKGVPLSCHFDYQPAERQTFYEPGCPEEVSLNACYIDCFDVSELLETDLGKIADKVLEEIHEQRKEALEP